MKDLKHKGKVKIVGKKPKDGGPLKGYDCRFYLDGKEIPFLQHVDIDFNLTATGPAIVLLKFYPTELEIELEEAEVIIRRKEE